MHDHELKILITTTTTKQDMLLETDINYAPLQSIPLKNNNKKITTNKQL
jgi:hypothetical protein